MPEGVLFDLDGVLVDSYEAWFPLTRAAAREFGVPPISREQFEAGWGQGLQQDVRSFFPGRSVQEVERFYKEQFRNHAEHVRVNPEAGAVLSGLRKGGVPHAVITNTPGPLARELLASVGLKVPIVIGGPDVPREKPAPDMVFRACELLEIKPSEALVVGDSRFDKKAAEAAGARFIGFGGIEAEETIDDLTELLCRLGRR